MKLLIVSLATAAMLTATSISSKADSGFGEGFTGQSPQAFQNPEADTDSGMASTAAFMNEMEPAAGDERTAMPTDTETENTAEQPNIITVPQIIFTEEPVSE